MSTDGRLGAPLHPAHGDFGVVLEGLSLGDGPSSGDAARLAEALRRHRLVVIHGQRLDEVAQLRLTAALGPLVATARSSLGPWPLPEVRYEADLGDGARKPVSAFYTEQWHSDLSWARERPPISVLHALEVGPGAAATAFADTAGGYDDLPATVKDSIEPWQAYHHLVRAVEVRGGRPPPRMDFATGARAEAERRRLLETVDRLGLPVRLVPSLEPPGALHRVVHVDPGSGRRCVFLGQHAYALAGWTQPDACRAIEELEARLLADRRVIRHFWRAGDLVLFDNLPILHRREPGSDGSVRRILRRTCCLLPDAAS